MARRQWWLPLWHVQPRYHGKRMVCHSNAAREPGIRCCWRTVCSMAAKSAGYPWNCGQGARNSRVGPTSWSSEGTPLNWCHTMCQALYDGVPWLHNSPRHHIIYKSRRLWIQCSLFYYRAQQIGVSRRAAVPVSRALHQALNMVCHFCWQARGIVCFGLWSGCNNRVPFLPKGHRTIVPCIPMGCAETVPLRGASHRCGVP